VAAPLDQTFPRRLSLRLLAATALIALLALVPAISAWAGQPFYLTLFTRVLIFALAAVGLNLVLGFGGLVSFGHALYIGVGAYAVGILSFHGVANGWAHLAAGLAVGAVVAIAVGLICLRTSGMAFIMITLAFAQMFYFLMVSLRQYGGDDGLTIAARSDFGLFSLVSPAALYYSAFGVLMAALYLGWRLIHSRFGMVLRGAKSNERRMLALGFPTLRYRLTAYVISALVCVVAGVLLANLTRYASPSYMQWTVSGELIVMIVLGGMSTLLGPVFGALALLAIEEALSGLKLGLPFGIDAFINSHWMGLLGLFIVAITLTARRGLYGFLVDRDRHQAVQRA
jgi:branched-chain amino acid transport system permease protein